MRFKPRVYQPFISDDREGTKGGVITLGMNIIIDIRTNRYVKKLNTIGAKIKCKCLY